MSNWLNLGFQDSASYLMEQMIFFYDFSFLIIFFLVLCFVIYMLFSLIFNL